MMIFDIKRYAINDGPGIRTTVFFKGCPLRCVWCHNPESWLTQPELLFKQQKCIGCNTCGIYPRQKEYIKGHSLTPPAREEGALRAVADLCPTMALEVCGKGWSVEEVMAQIEKEREIMTESGGGVTVSGGEPLMQHRELITLLKACGKQGFHRAVDTTLYAPTDIVEAVARETDLFLVDLKVMDDDLHRRLTGVSNELILSNIRRLNNIGAPFQIRIPLIEGVNADEENIRATAQFIHSTSECGARPVFMGVSLLPYHEMGRDKHTRRGSTYNPERIPMGVPSDQIIQRCIRQFYDHGLIAKVGG